MTAPDPSCLADIRAQLRRWLPAAGIGARDGADILVAVGEAAANAIEHAPAGRGGQPDPVRIAITARIAGEAVEITVGDTGTWRPPPEKPGTRGHGIPFMSEGTVGDTTSNSAAGSDQQPRFDVIPGTGQQPATVRAAGDIDLASAARFGAALTGAAASSEITADLTAVTYCDSVAIHALLTTARYTASPSSSPRPGPSPPCSRSPGWTRSPPS